MKVGPSFAGARQAYAPALARWDALIERVADLFIRLNTGQAEVVATVLFAAEGLHQQGSSPSEQDVFHEVMAWKQRRRPPLSEGEVAWSIRNLAALGWLRVRASRDLPVLREDDVLYG